MAQTNMTTAKQLVRQKLLSVTALTDLVADRIYGEFPVDPNARTVAYPIVVVDFFSGKRNVSSTYQEVNCHVYVFSRQSSDQASRLYDICANNLHMQKLSHTSIGTAGYAVETARGNEQWDVNGRAHVMFGRFKIRLGGEA